jgi:hypothetical protein
MSTDSRVMHETYMTTMTAAEWAQVADNPRQRDTVGRAAKAKHLDVLEPTHTLVSIAELPDGKRYKLDAHTRAYKWLADPRLAPQSLLDVRVYVVPDLSEVKRLYMHFDGKAAVETAADAVFGGMREVRISPKSEFVRRSRFAAALTAAYSYICGDLVRVSHYERVRFFQKQIRALDAFVGATKRMCSPASCVYFLAHRKHGDVVNDFFQRFIKDEGVKDGRRRDCVQWFSELMGEYVKAARGKGPVFNHYVGHGLRCVEMWLNDRATMTTRPAAAIDPHKYGVDDK